MKFNIDDRVYYVSGRFGKTETNPCKGSVYECTGTVTSRDIYNISVDWDNGYHNTYGAADLELVHRFEANNPNLLWKWRKRYDVI